MSPNPTTTIAASAPAPLPDSTVVNPIVPPVIAPVQKTASQVAAEEFDIDSLDMETDQEPVVEQKPAEKPQQRKPGGTSGRDHSAVTLNLARELGIPDAEIAATDPATLDLAVQHMVRGRLGGGGVESTMRQPQATQPTEEEVAVEFGDDEDETTGQKRKFTEADFRPALVGAFKAQAKAIKALEKELAEVRQHSQAGANQARFQQVNTGFDSLGDEFKGVFGKTEAVKPNSAELHRRKLVLMSLQENPPRLQLPLPQLVAMRAKELFGGALPAVPAAKPKEESGVTAEEWDDAGVRLPSQRVQSNAPAGRKKAIGAIRDQLKSYAKEEAVIAGATSDLDGFLE